MKKILLACLLCHTFFSGYLLADDSVENNKKIVLKLYTDVFNQKNLGIADQLIDSNYIQHNPYVATGLSPFKEYFKHLFTKYSQFHADIKKMIAEKHRVMVHVHYTISPNDRGSATVDL